MIENRRKTNDDNDDDDDDEAEPLEPATGRHQEERGSRQRAACLVFLLVEIKAFFLLIVFSHA